MPPDHAHETAAGIPHNHHCRRRWSHGRPGTACSRRHGSRPTSEANHDTTVAIATAIPAVRRRKVCGTGCRPHLADGQHWMGRLPSHCRLARS
jgi:hypothetical protein